MTHNSTKYLCHKMYGSPICVKLSVQMIRDAHSLKLLVFIVHYYELSSSKWAYFYPQVTFWFSTKIMLYITY